MVTSVLVCGGRTFNDQEHVNTVLNAVRAHYGEIIIIHGNAGGADNCAGLWAHTVGVHQARVPALWPVHHKASGPIRNSMMLKLQPDVCIGFPGGPGTADMLKKARAAGIPTYEV